MELTDKQCYGFKPSLLPKAEHIRKRSISRGWKILQELIAGIRNHNEINRIKSLPTMLLVVAHATNMALSEYQQEKQVPSIQQLIKRAQYVKNYLRLRDEVITYKMHKGVSQIKAAGLQLRYSIFKEMGIDQNIFESAISRYSRIDPLLRTSSENQYLMRWIASKLPKNGIIDQFYKKCKYHQKLRFINGLKYRYYSSKSP